MARAKEQLQNLVDRFRKGTPPTPAGVERMRKQQEAAKKAVTPPTEQTE